MPTTSQEELPKVTLMSDQQAFTTVYRHLLTQHEKSQDDVKCRYRYRKGNKILKCAVGCLIPNRIYTSAMEDLGVKQLFDEYPHLEALLEGVSGEMLRLLQNAHDDFEINEWETQLRYIAEQFQLEPPKMKLPK
jgi:hypothetical protein